MPTVSFISSARRWIRRKYREKTKENNVKTYESKHKKCTKRNRRWSKVNKSEFHDFIAGFLRCSTLIEVEEIAATLQRRRRWQRIRRSNDQNARPMHPVSTQHYWICTVHVLSACQSYSLYFHYDMKIWKVLNSEIHVISSCIAAQISLGVRASAFADGKACTPCTCEPVVAVSVVYRIAYTRDMRVCRRCCCRSFLCSYAFPLAAAGECKRDNGGRRFRISIHCELCGSCLVFNKIRMRSSHCGLYHRREKYAAQFFFLLVFISFVIETMLYV